ncbi:unnamed protein product [Lasius platythorax]|uniref:Retrovirus-related Pol polyprotein from transposon TNT 1-94 n=1 Tax=Lasius platythorax TaxID=488582 RepID=A0AAV2P7Q0_9HYME
MYLAITTRPDIAFSVSVVSQSLESPKQSDWQAVKRIFKYLRGTLSTKLLYRTNYKPGMLKAFSDADYAGDIQTRRSTSGIVCKYFGGAISWMSQKQRSVALSTTEAEFIAANEGTKEVIWLKRLLQEITVLNEVPTLMIDNASAIKLVKNPEFHKRSKHVEVRYYFVREKYHEGVINVEHVASIDQIADIMTKPLAKVQYLKLVNMLGLSN